MIELKKVKKLYKEAGDGLEMSHTNDRALMPNIQGTLADVSFCPKDIKEYFSVCNNCTTISCKGKMTYHVMWSGVLSVPMTAILRSMRQALVVREAFGIRKDMCIYVIMSPSKRHLPHKNEQVDCQHVNGGFTSCGDSEIFVLRSEEFSKVILHELLHHCTFINDNRNYANRELKKAFNVSKSTLLLHNEAVIEYWASLLHCFFLSVEYGMAFDSLMRIETSFSMLQAGKILRKQGTSVWEERTNSFAYIVLKAILLKNHVKFSKIAYPYDAGEVTDFMVRNRSSVKKDDSFGRVFSETRHRDSLRMMYLSDYI